MILLVDTNIFLDLQTIGLLEDVMTVMTVNNSICIEASLFRDEIRQPPDLADHLRSLGISIVVATDEEFQLSQEMSSLVPQLSFYDSITYAVAKTRQYTLLTGDKRLRQTAVDNGVDVHGLLFLVDEGIKLHIPKDHISAALQEILRNPRIFIKPSIIYEKYSAFLSD